MLQTFSWGFMPCMASTPHSRNQRVLLPVNRRFPRHNSTPTRRNQNDPISNNTHMTQYSMQLYWVNYKKRSPILSMTRRIIALMYFSCLTYYQYWAKNTLLSVQFICNVPISPSSASQVITQRCILASQTKICPRLVAVNRKESL